MKDVLSYLRGLNERYSMFRCVADDTETSGTEFLFSAEDGLTSKDMEARCGSRILEGYRPVFDAASIEKMRFAGGKLAGKTNMDEFRFGSFCTNSPYGVPKNPFDPERSCGGSAGGSACAAAVIDDHISLGVSCGGSICCPASFCGVYGFVPTYGRVSRHGVIDSAGSVDRVGLISRNPERLSEFFPIISGEDLRDPTSCAQPDNLPQGVRIKSVAVPEEAYAGLSGDVLSAFDSSLEALRGMGIEVDAVKMPSLRYSMPALYMLTAAEASTFLASFVGMRYGQQDGDLTLKFDDYFTSFRTEYFGDEAKRRILLGTYARMAVQRDRYYLRALRARDIVISSYKKVFAEHDAVLTPTMPFAPPRFDEISRMTPAESYDAGRFIVPPDLAGMPCLSVPCGYNDKGMPIGMNMVTDHWAEDPLLTFAKEWDSAFGVRRPEVSL
ncbi:MAG: Asp-tRNA(Asn)/Glu-tRNA(Gln) amidotransferase subunit GatA [Candidatus Methanoplasma sp.]|jgi:aspartyl-tRNA(Asn)/glutamyl-tRNA(Gln) amidotransferase subunit A|nr:Asp-tRNA(Asn)/Glu-tRNA(Gln) amidotransferase subunit GatA [Candidatus Methanoplasma sp.]